ncbi:MAG: GNAT family N-acetyltransferase [Planctomycetes bacterium]|nr:GNAT family N-acetyltransferase [Planctomycetota bacterium]
MRLPPKEFAARDGRRFVVRSARANEAGALFDHYLLIRAREPDVNVEEADEWMASADSVRRLIEGLDRAANGFLLVADAGGIVGALSIEGGRFRKVRHVGEVGVSVARGWRRQGVGRRLMETAIDAARTSKELSRLSLRVFSSNAPAIALYESLGFVVEGRRPGHLRIRGRDEDLILMGLPLR